MEVAAARGRAVATSATTLAEPQHRVSTGGLPDGSRVAVIPSDLNPPSGCPFHTRCHRKIEGLCDYEIPPLKHLSSGHDISCHLADEDLNSMAPVFRSGKKAAA